MKDFVNNFFFNPDPEPLEDIDTDPLEDTDTDTEGHPDQFSEYNLFNVDFSAAVQITHANVERALKDRCSSKSGLLEFYTDWTGRGKGRVSNVVEILWRRSPSIGIWTLSGDEVKGDWFDWLI